MASNGLHMGDVINSIRRHKNIILVITALTAVAGALFYLAGPKKYEGKTEFIVRNPVYSDRNNLYNYDTKFIDYFANEDDIDRVILMSESEIVQSRVIRNLHLAEAYGIDASNRKGEQQLARKFSKNYNITRTEYKDLVLAYVDVDPERAAKVANEIVKVLDSTFIDYYREMRQHMYQSIADKIKEEDSTINALTDTLVLLREHYGIYDIISPARNNLMLSPMNASGKKDFARGLEMVQNVESLKDQVVADRAKQTTIYNQFNTGTRIDQMPMIKVVTYAKNPVSPKGIGGMYTVLACAFLGFFFSTMLMSFTDRYFGKP
jgi:capsular polysaccharide biosynthesis protein